MAFTKFGYDSLLTKARDAVYCKIGNMQFQAEILGDGRYKFDWYWPGLSERDYRPDTLTAAPTPYLLELWNLIGYEKKMEIIAHLEKNNSDAEEAVKSFCPSVALGMRHQILFEMPWIKAELEVLIKRSLDTPDESFSKGPR